MFNIIISFIPWSIYSWVVNENVFNSRRTISHLNCYFIVHYCCKY